MEEERAEEEEQAGFVAVLVPTEVVGDLDEAVAGRDLGPVRVAGDAPVPREVLNFQSFNHFLSKILKKQLNVLARILGDIVMNEQLLRRSINSLSLFFDN